MQHIKKLSTKTEAHRLIDGFLGRCQNGGSWPQDLYNALESDKDDDESSTFSAFRQELLKETNGLCCYCMRTLTESNTTLEHVIPNKVETQDKYNEYKGYYTDEEWNKLIFSKAFLLNPSWPNSKCPHTVAYENLIPSCNGKMADLRTDQEKADHVRDARKSICCNNKRGSSFIPPFVFNESMIKEFEYKKNGILVWNDDSPEVAEKKRVWVSDEEKGLNLNCEELVAIRRIWYFLANNGYDCNIEQDKREAILLVIASFAKAQERDSIYKFQNPNYWCLLNEYRYFNDTTKFTE